MSYSPIHANDIESLRSLVQFSDDYQYLDIQAVQRLHEARQQWPLLAELHAISVQHEQMCSTSEIQNFSTMMAHEAQA